MLAHRRSHPSPNRSYYDAQQGYGDESEVKRQRTASAGHNHYSLRHGPSAVAFSYSSMGPIVAHQSPFLTTAESEATIYAPAYNSRDAFNSGMAPIGMPRSGSSRVDPQISTYHGDMFSNPGNQTPSNPYAYVNTTNDPAIPIQHQQQHAPMSYYQPEGHLPTLNRALATGGLQGTTSPQGQHQVINTPVSSTGSPHEGLYTHAAAPFPTPYMPHTAESYDQGTLRNHGIPTPVTGVPPGQFLSGQPMSTEDPLGFGKGT